MTSDYRGEIRAVSLISLFIMVVPLIFFPKDFGLKLGFSWLSLFALEFGWYLLVLFLMFSKAPGLLVLLCACLTLGYRICLGVGFGLLLLVMFSHPLSSSLELGIYQYAPAFLLQALMSPFALKSIWGGFMKKASTAADEHILFRSTTRQAVSSSAPERVIDKPDGRGSLSLEKDLKSAREDHLENILRYLREYTGVKAAILVDQEGLVIGKECTPDFDSETVASFVRWLKEANDQILRKMSGERSERIGIYTPNLWISLNQIESFLLVVVSDRHTDELLSVRIQQSIGMIKRFLNERYQEKALKALEG